MFEKLRKAATARRQAKREKGLGRVEAELEAGQTRHGLSTEELTDFNETTRMGPIIGTGGGPV